VKEHNSPPCRGTFLNPSGRFERLALEPEPGQQPDTDARFFRDATREILSRNDSPDVGFETSLSPYRGCEHGCIYCYARPSHEYLGFSAGLDFERTILVKQDAAELLRQRLSSPAWKPQVIAFSGVTDAWQPVERRLRVTRSCLEVLVEFLNPMSAVTKSSLVTRDLDLLRELAAHGAAMVMFSLTTLDHRLQRRMEPRAASPSQRLMAMEKLAAGGVPVAVMVAPVIPGFTDHELPSLLTAARNAGAGWAGYQLLRLPHGVGALFQDWLERHYPRRADRVLNRIREVRGGELSDSRFHLRMTGEGEYARQLSQLFHACRKRLGFVETAPPLSTASFRRPGQLGLPLG
jgi:DNA repair photolyase